ncbi:MAG: hypothetical protein Q8S41_00760 [Lutibacter sp.]|nr:hypothetical protein [Lutibacter sp.]
MKRKLNRVLQLFFIATILIGIGYNLHAEYSGHSDKIVLSSEDNSEESFFVFDMDSFEEDQIKHHIENNILVTLNFENYNFKNSFLILQVSFIIWQPPKNYS